MLLATARHRAYIPQSRTLSASQMITLPLASQSPSPRISFLAGGIRRCWARCLGAQLCAAGAPPASPNCADCTVTWEIGVKASWFSANSHWADSFGNRQASHVVRRWRPCAYRGGRRIPSRTRASILQRLGPGSLFSMLCGADIRHSDSVPCMWFIVCSESGHAGCPASAELDGMFSTRT